MVGGAGDLQVPDFTCDHEYLGHEQEVTPATVLTLKRKAESYCTRARVQ